MENITKEQVLSIVDDFVKELKTQGKEKRKTAVQRAWHIVVHKILPLGKNFPNGEIDINFVITALIERGIGNEEKEVPICPTAQKEKSAVHFDTRSPEEKRIDEERENCPQCDLGGGGCPRHRRPH